jgi:hypothetical protein
MQTSPLEAPPRPEERPSERRWAVITLGALALICLMAVVALRSLSKAHPAAPVTPVNHGPLPAELRQGVLDLLTPHLDHLQLVEHTEDGVREFRIKGRPKAPLAKEFHAIFRPLVVNELMPRLRPYGEVLSFEIDNLDYPPARLRPLPGSR